MGSGVSVPGTEEEARSRGFTDADIREYATQATTAPPAGLGNAAPAFGRDDGDTECAVCLGELQQPSTLPCGHRFCRACVDSMRQHSSSSSSTSPQCRCPLCRAPMPDAERLALEASHALAKFEAWDVRHRRAGLPRGHQVPPAHELLRLAASALRDLLALEPGRSAAHFELAYCLQHGGDAAGALTAYRRAAECEPAHARAHLGVGNMLRLGGVGVGDDHAGAHEAEAAFRRATAAAAAAAAAEDGGGAATALPEAHFNLANLLLEERGDAGGAEAAYRAALAADPLFVAAHCNLGALLLEHRRDAAGAEACYRAAIAVDPQHANAHYNLGVILAMPKAAGGRGAEAAARRCFQAAARLDPTHVGAWVLCHGQHKYGIGR